MTPLRIAVLGGATGWHVQRLAAAIARRGHAPFVVGWGALGGVVETGGERFVPAAVDTAHLVVVRGMPGASAEATRLEDVIFRMDVLGRVEARGTPVVNPPRALEAAIDKYLSLARLAAAGLPVPRTRVLQAADDVEAVAELGDTCVVKPLFGSGGRGLERLPTGEAARRLGEQPQAVHYLQEYLPHAGWDVRVLVVGGDLVAIRRRAAPGEWRTNLSCGGRAEPFHIPADWADMARRAAAILGAEVAGVDLLPASDGRLVVLEVNGVPGWRGLEAATGLDVADRVAAHLEARAGRR